LRRSWLTPALPYEVHGANATNANIGCRGFGDADSGALRRFRRAPNVLYADLCLASASAYSRRA